MTKNDSNITTFIRSFYRNKFKDNLFVIKAGGRLVEDARARDNLLANIADLTGNGVKILLVYGGGAVTDKALTDRGIAIRKHQGRRITDRATLDVMGQILGGELSLRVLESMSKAGLDGLSFNAVPAGWLDAELRPKDPVDFGLVGDILETHDRPVRRLLRTHNFIATTCLCMSRGHQICNINADTVATALACGLKADKLLFLSDVDGVMINEQVASLITDRDIPEMIAEGSVTGGMQVKLETCMQALREGVKRIHLINGFRKDALLKEVMEPVGPGTMIIRETERKNYMNEMRMQ